MSYFITRNGRQYGPYTLADLQRYAASGEILLTDLARGEGMSEPLPVSQVIGAGGGTIAVPQAQILPGPLGGRPTNPPNLHWGLVLLFSLLSWGLFSAAWNLVQAAWMKGVAPQSKALYYYTAGLCVLGAIFFTSFGGSYRHAPKAAGRGLDLVYAILVLIGRFSLKSSLEEYYNAVDPIGLSLSGVMTFFFGDIYFQYHFNAIMRRKKDRGLSSLTV